ERHPAREPEEHVHERLTRARLHGDLIGAEPGQVRDRGAHPRILLEERAERAEASPLEEGLERLRLGAHRLAGRADGGEGEGAGLLVEPGREVVDREAHTRLTVRSGGAAWRRRAGRAGSRPRAGPGRAPRRSRTRCAPTATA